MAECHPCDSGLRRTRRHRVCRLVFLVGVRIWLQARTQLCSALVVCTEYVFKQMQPVSTAAKQVCGPEEEASANFGSSPLLIWASRSVESTASARSSSNWRPPTCTRGVPNATRAPALSDRCPIGWWPRLPASSQRRPYFQTGHAARYRYRSPPRQKARAERASRRFARRCCEQPRLLCSWATRGSRRTALPPMAVTNTQFGPPFSKFSSGRAPHPRP